MIFQQIMRPIYAQKRRPEKRSGALYACRMTSAFLMFIQALGSFPSLNMSIISLVRE
jgi:hypothetical protein